MVASIVSSVGTPQGGSTSAPLAGARAPASPQPAPKPLAQPDQSGSTDSATHSTPGHDELKKLVSTMQSKVAQTTSDLEFSIDKESGKSVVKVTERSSKEVIWQFPSEQALQVTKELDRYMGAFLNRTA